MTGRRARSASSSVFFTLIVVAVTLGLIVGGLLIWDRQRGELQEAERVTQTLASAIALSPMVSEGLANAPIDEPDRVDPAAFQTVSAELQQFARVVMSDAEVSYVTIMSPDGMRYTHRDPAEIGREYIGTIPSTPRVHTEVYRGTLGPSIRTIVPVERDGELLGWVAVGVGTNAIGDAIVSELPLVAAITLTLIGMGAGGAFVGRRFTRKLTGDLSSKAVRDATSSYESVRTLGAAIRAQHHEYGNRMHTAVGLLELGRTDEAIELLSETGRQQRDLVSVLAVQASREPEMSALILGKTAQGRELGIELFANIDADAPKQPLRPIDAVSVMGNLIDNAFDAAAAGPPPRTVHFDVRSGADGSLVIDVTDSGLGFSSEARERMFEPGFSTKPAGAEGRGIGLSLSRRIVENAGGTIQVDEDPTTLRVTLPATAPPTAPLTIRGGRR